MKSCPKCLKNIAKNAETLYGLHIACFCSWFDLVIPEEFSGLQRRASSTGSTLDKRYLTAAWNTSFFQGKFRKYSAELANHSYILKLTEKSAPELPMVEYLCNQIAESLKLPVPQYYLLKFQEEWAFVTKNFINATKGKQTLTHIYHYLKPRDEYNCQTLLAIIDAESGRFPDTQLFIETCLFDSLIGNHDRHGRNLGFVVTHHGMTLSPMYDNPSALGLESGPILKATFEPRGKIYTKTSKEPLMQDYVKEFKRLNYTNIVNEFAKRIDIEKVYSLIEQSFCSDLMKQALKKLITRRHQELSNEL